MEIKAKLEDKLVNKIQEKEETNPHHLNIRESKGNVTKLHPPKLHAKRNGTCVNDWQNSDPNWQNGDPYE